MSELKDLLRWIDDYNALSASNKLRAKSIYERKVSRIKELSQSINKERLIIGAPVGRENEDFLLMEALKRIKKKEDGMIKIEFKNKANRLLFSHVVDNEFFISMDEYFCQKIDSSSYIIIANAYGSPYGEYMEVDEDEEIEVLFIFPRVEKIHIPDWKSFDQN